MQIEAKLFRNNEKIPSKYTCDGDNINPELWITEIPNTTKSLVLIVEDPDAPSGLFTHWILFNIDPSTEVISEGRPPIEADEGQNSFGRASYGGPCPPEGTGTHRYFFRLFALSDTLKVANGATRQQVFDEMKDKIEATAELVGLYGHDNEAKMDALQTAAAHDTQII